MLSQKEIEKAGYTVLPHGGWIRIDPQSMPHDWHDLSKDFGFDPNAESVILCVCGIKEESCVDME
jgi:hypothetical protein